MADVQTTPLANLPALPDRIRTSDEIATRRGNLTYRGRIPEAARGEVTQAELTAEAQRRAAGDDLQSIEIHSLAALNSALASQANATTALEMVFRADVQKDGTTYRDGDVVYVSPGSVAIEGRFQFVTPDALRAVNEARQDGDEIRLVTVASAALMASSIRLHGTGDHASVFQITAKFGRYNVGQRWYLAEHHNQESELVLIADHPVIPPAAPKYAATLAVWPPNVRLHSDFQRRFQSTLTGLDPELATDAGSTGTRFTNTFRILTRNADGAIVELHTQGWSFTNDDRQSIPWEVSAAEFNMVGAESATSGIQVWGEFRAVYGGGVDELRGTTNPVFMDFGEEDEWPATRGDLRAQGLSLPQKIGLLNLIPDPALIAFRNADALTAAIRQIEIGIPNPTVLDGDVWVQIQVQGQNANIEASGRTPAQPQTRLKWATNYGGLVAKLSASTAEVIANARATDPSIEVRLRWYSSADAAANEDIVRTGFSIPIINTG